MLKTIRLLNLALKVLKTNDNKVVDNNGCRANKMVMNLFKNNKSRNLICIPNIKAIKKPTFLTPNTKKILNHLRQAFIKAPIFQHFDLESHIQIETNVLSNAIGEMLS